MKEENTNGSPVDTHSPDQKKKRIKHVERRVRFSDTYIKSLKPRDKPYSVGDSEVVGLRIYVEISGTKTFYYAYKPLSEKNWVRYKIGNFNIINVIQARNKAKKYVS